MSTHSGVCNFCGTGCGHLLKVDGRRRQGRFRLSRPSPQPGPAVRPRLAHPRASGHRRPDRHAAHPPGRPARTGPTMKPSRSRPTGSPATPATRSPSWRPRALQTRTTISWPSWPGRSSVPQHRPRLRPRPRRRRRRPARGRRHAGYAGRADGDSARPSSSWWRARTSPELNPIVGSEIHLAARNGAEVISLSSRQTQIAKLSRKHLWLNPGTMRHALAAVAKVMVERGLEDKDFLRAQTDGFRGLFTASCPAWISRRSRPRPAFNAARSKTWPAGSPEARSAMAFFSSGISGLDRGSVALLYNLFLAAGQVGREGCGVNPVTGICNIVGSYDVGAVHPVPPRPQAGRGPGRRAHAEAAPRGRPDARSKPWSWPTATRRSSGTPTKLQGLECVVFVSAYTNPFVDFAHIVLPVGVLRRSRWHLYERRAADPAQPQEGRAAGGRPPRLARLCRYRREARRRLVLCLGRRSSWPRSPRPSPPMPASPTPSSRRASACSGRATPATRTARPGCRAADAPRRLQFVPAGRRTSPSPAPSEDFPFLLMAGKANYFWHRNNIMKKTHIPKREYNALLLLYPQGFVEVAAADAARTRRPGPRARQRRLGRRLDAGRRPHLRGRQAGNGLRALLHRGHGPRLPERRRELRSTRTRIPSIPVRIEKV